MSEWTAGPWAKLGEIGGVMLYNPDGRNHVFVPSKWRPDLPEHVVMILAALNKACQ
jgi:hypothetical protein